MSIWICRPSLIQWGVDVNLGLAEMFDSGFIKNISDTKLKVDMAEVLDGDTILILDTENIQKSLYDAFCNSEWENGENFHFCETNIFRADEQSEYFDVYVNEKYIAKFYKDRRL